MLISRRRALELSLAFASVSLAGLEAGPALATPAEAEELIKSFSRGETPVKERVVLTLPEVAENGNTVPVSVSVESAMTGDDLVQEVLIVAEGNPLPEVARFQFTPLSGEASVSTRIRLADSQDVMALARMADGSVFIDRRSVNVTIGGCGS